MKTKIKLLLLAVAMAVIALTAAPASAATMSASLTPPVVDGEDVANYIDTGHLDKWFCISGEAASKVMGQSFTTGDAGAILNAITYQVADSQKAEPTKTYTIRVGTVSGTTFTEIYSETATQTFTWNASEYMTWTLDTPVLLEANTVYAMDVGMNSSTSGWQTGIPYLQYSSTSQYAGGTRYISGTGTPPGVGDTTMQSTTGDRVFHIDMDVVDDPDTDTDADGLTNLEEYQVGTNPTVADTDGDGAGDWYEVVASFTEPTDAGDKPIIPYPLPDPDASTGNSNPVKVYILSGQSNMVGMGVISGTSLGTLDTITKVENKFPNLLNEAEAWTVRNDVRYRGVITAIGNGLLTPGVMGSKIGPEMGFGHVMGYYHNEPVIVLKSSQGNRSLLWDFCPPGTPRFEYGAYTYAGYGDTPDKWLTGTTPVPINWYAGYQYDQCFLNEADMAGTIPITAFNVVDVLDNFASQYPQYAAQGFEIAGFAWWQGHKDQYEPAASRYEYNLVNFIKAVRAYYENRYPANTVPDAPFVLATVAFDGGWGNTSPYFLAIANGQLAVSGETGNYPEFRGNVKTMEARGYWRDASISPTTAGYHYNGNAETYMLVGDALGRAMVELLTGINEMEDGVMSGAQVASNHAGYTGTGFVDYTVSTGAYVQLTVNVPTGGNYDLSYRYALASGNRPLQIKVNGQVVAASLSFPATGAWTTWGYTATVPVTLNAGNNTVRATTIGSNGANVDHLLIERY